MKRGELRGKGQSAVATYFYGGNLQTSFIFRPCSQNGPLSFFLRETWAYGLSDCRVAAHSPLGAIHDLSLVPSC